ncbi:SNARE-binding exocyst subunit SEC6 NDAI_0E04900 [Naumovozyma dairenensis CBS 421]|uniref:Uncharacterized protein n=1 Tax=Naumovozyma dairenensis (strain ATCC 10597 / BCRC 20456 / CBS 421 / NBRC 0211 / NRRL Y-12639) TaxID=1071378 RepID=G0WAN4_NAUDC|nr:hypothetical protein NDAI_0E04900 [Naumovozyma dairenensis CBS 421]CCD25307.1 hypothetical protein NDAI_0E04900 [Naumovozyma dairenensis CBS 421]
MSSIPKISDLIKTDLSLERIRDIKEQFLKQKSTIEYQLNKESEKYYGNVQESLNLLNTSQKSVNAIKERLNDVDKLSKESKSSIDRYDVIFDATKLYDTINTTSAIYDKIMNFTNLVDKMDQMLEQELSMDAIESGCPYLLDIHYSLTIARDFQDRMNVMAQVSTDDVQRIVQKVFNKVSGLVTKFDQLLESLIYDLVEIVRSGQISLAIRLFKIIDLEEREDLRITAIRNIIKKKEIQAEKSSIRKLPNNKNAARLLEDEHSIVEYPTPNGLYNEILSGTIASRTLPRGYRNFFFNKLQQSIADMFIEVRKEYKDEKTFEVLNNLDWVFNELLMFKEHISLYCSKHWNIFDKAYEYYYNEMHILVNELVESEPETIIILDILDFDKSFQQTLIKDFGFKKKDIKSIIGPEQKEKLFKDYLNLIVEKMTEWISNLEKAEFVVFLERATPPHIDPEGLLFLDGTKTCFQMFTQQVEVASGSGQAKILVGVIEKFTNLLLIRQKHWIANINSEVKRLLRYNELYDIDPQNIPEEDQCPGGLLEYLIAVSNDQMRAADYTMALSTKYGNLVSKVYEKEISIHMNRSLDGFAEVVKCTSNGLLSIIFDDLKGPYHEIFSKSWYTGSQVQQISDTLNEYLVDIKAQMSPVVFSVFIGNIIDESFLQFINALNEHHSFKSKNNKFLGCMKRDFEIFFELFAKFVPEENKQEIIDVRFKVMEYFIDLSCGPLDEIMDTWANLLVEYPETPIDFLTGILTCRKDVDSSDRKHMLKDGIININDPERVKRLNNKVTEISFISRFVFNSSK